MDVATWIVNRASLGRAPQLLPARPQIVFLQETGFRQEVSIVACRGYQWFLNQGVQVYRAAVVVRASPRNDIVLDAMSSALGARDGHDPELSGAEICAAVYIPHATSSAASFEGAVNEARGLYGRYVNMIYGGGLLSSGTQALQDALSEYPAANIKRTESPTHGDLEVHSILGMDSPTQAIRPGCHSALNPSWCLCTASSTRDAVHGDIPSAGYPVMGLHNPVARLAERQPHRYDSNPWGLRDAWWRHSLCATGRRARLGWPAMANTCPRASSIVVTQGRMHDICVCDTRIYE